MVVSSTSLFTCFFWPTLLNEWRPVTPMSRVRNKLSPFIHRKWKILSFKYRIQFLFHWCSVAYIYKFSSRFVTEFYIHICTLVLLAHIYIQNGQCKSQSISSSYVLILFFSYIWQWSKFSCVSLGGGSEGWITLWWVYQENSQGHQEDWG